MNMKKELALLDDMTVGQLRHRYADVFGEPTRSRHRQYLVRRIAWRLQANTEGGLSQRALRRAEELAGHADVRLTPPKDDTPERIKCESKVTTKITRLDPRLPPIGSDIVREYKGKQIAVKVRPDGFEYQGDRFKSLSAVAKAISGTHCNGFRFFGLDQ